MFLLNRKFSWTLFSAFIFFSFPFETHSSQQGEEVSQWATSIGKDLWTLGQAITRYVEIKQKYTFLNAKIQKKDPKALLAEIKANMSIMINTKIEAITSIQNNAEKFAEQFAEKTLMNISSNYSYYSSRYSPMQDENIDLPGILQSNSYMYRNMTVNEDTHFYNLPVNTNYSSVHVPVNVYDLEVPASSAIQWSEALDEIFKENYISDPALSWQYFGSATGIMRHYPAWHWPEKKAKTNKELLLFDCRIRTWFIEAATCTKDVVILIDNSGSMYGMGHHIGSLTAFSILDTFSNNDYVNVLNYSSTTNYTIPCFEDMLVQATEENIIVFKEAIKNLKQDGKTNIGQALIVAFQLLEKYRVARGCSGNSSNCNQAIMVITDGISSNMSDIIMKYNFLNNGSNIPVRIFTYLVGKESINVDEIKWMSCANRGYYTPVQSLEQVTASVLQYISVIARPLVLQSHDHPVSWTHAYADLTYDDETDNTINEPYRLLSSAAIPCYDTTINKMNNTRTAYLLGVAGTDVPLDEFQRITVPYKLGVNGYAFIVSNNGYVLMHPDLRPVFEGVLKDNYNSVDLSQVEQHAANQEPRILTESVKNLRKALVDGEDGSMLGVELNYHYDDMKRVFEATYDYYYTGIENTPFSLGIAIPNEYGNYALEVGNEILRNKHTGENLTSFFTGKWKVHPKWVYCKYHYLEGHEFDTPEAELLEFLEKMYDRNFKWESQYEDYGKQKRRLEQHDYYCDMHLVQRLIFDARITHEFFNDKWKFRPRETLLFERYDASLRFVATMSGLTRWEYIENKARNKSKRDDPKEFGDLHPKAINEKWYKSAVLQHQYGGESFVYSVPFDAAYDPNSFVTGSFAIFPSDGGKEAPGSVVGYQFSQRKLRAKFKDIGNKLSNRCSDCSRCNDSLDCYVVDSSGYIIVSERSTDTGRFFGEVEGDIFQSMISENIFKQMTLYDYQALCEIVVNTNSSSLLTKSIQDNFKWILWIFSSIKDIVWDVSGLLMGIITDEEPLSKEYYACEKKLDLFVLQQGETRYREEVPYERNYYVKPIPNSNLIFVAINNTVIKQDDVIISTSPVAITFEAKYEYDTINTTLLPCQKRDLNNLERRRLKGCYNEHPLEHEIKDCGKAITIQVNIALLLLSTVMKLL